MTSGTIATNLTARSRAIVVARCITATVALTAIGGCVTTHILAAADKVKLESSVALEGQMYKDLAEDSGVPKKVIRAETAGLYCSDESVLVGSGEPAPDGGLACPKVNR